MPHTIAANAAWKRTLCEHVPGPEEIKAWLGSSYNPAHHLTGKMLLTKWPSGKAEGLLKIKKTFKLQTSASSLLKAGLPYVITDRLVRWEAMERIKETGCHECLSFVCHTQVVDGKGYFSFTEVLIRYAEEKTGIQRCNFHNTSHAGLPMRNRRWNTQKQNAPLRIRTPRYTATSQTICGWFYSLPPIPWAAARKSIWTAAGLQG